MAVKKTSAKKRHEQSEVRRMHNKAIKSKVHTTVRKYLDSIEKKDQDLAATNLTLLQSELDRANTKGVIKPNACARKKSRMANLYNKTFTPAK